MAAKEKERRSSFTLTNILNFFENLTRSSKSTSPKAKNVSSVDETCNESVNREPVVQKEELIHWPPVNNESRSKGNDDSKASSKDLQDKDKDNKNLTRPVETEVECIIETVQTEEERQLERNLIQNRSGQDRSKSVERPRNEQQSVQSDSPRWSGFKTNEERQLERNLIQNRSGQDRSKSVERPRNEQQSVQSDLPRWSGFKTNEERQLERNLIQNRSGQDRSKSVERPRNEQQSVQSDLPRWSKFKTEDGRWLCQVCSWSSSDSTIMSFLDHCSSTNHREKMKGRFEQELRELYQDNLPEVRNKAGESKADSQSIKWSQVKKNEDISIAKKKSKICNSKKPTTEMICKSQQTQNRGCQESSKEEGLTSRMKNLLKEELSVEEPFKALTALLENKSQNDKRVNEMKPEAAGIFKEKLFEVVKQEEKAEVRKDERKKAKKKTDEKTNLNANKVEKDAKVNTSNTTNLRKGGEGNSQSENRRIDEIKTWISALGITFIEPVSVSFLRCKLCEKLLPAGSNLETLVINVGIHVEGKPHIKKLELILEASNVIVNLMKRIQKSPTGSLPNLSEKNCKTKKQN